MKLLPLIVFFGIMVMIPAPGAGAEIGGVLLPDQIMADETPLILNGAGLRKKIFVKVYAGGLYLKQKNSDPESIIESDELMGIRMHFIHDGVSPQKLIEAWNDGFHNATGGDIAPIKTEIDRFNSFFVSDAKRDDVYDLIYRPGQGVHVIIKGKTVGTIFGLEFKKALFRIWLGSKPADNGLKSGMLGK